MCYKHYMTDNKSMRKTELFAIRITKEDSKLLSEICDEFGVRPSTFVSAAVINWLSLCRVAGGYVKPLSAKDVGRSEVNRV